MAAARKKPATRKKAAARKQPATRKKAAGKEQPASQKGAAQKKPAAAAQKTAAARKRPAAKLKRAGGLKVRASTSLAPLDVPGDLAAAIAADDLAVARWSSFAPSHRREYVEWVVEAKRRATREARIESAVKLIAGRKDGR